VDDSSESSEADDDTKPRRREVKADGWLAKSERVSAVARRGSGRCGL
jgi:hypothetical protein